MEITRKGTVPSERTWVGECRSCKSEAIASEGELSNIINDTRENYRFSWEVCPVCYAGKHDDGYGGMLFYPKKQTMRYK
jgi:hypothetical protein